MIYALYMSMYYFADTIIPKHLKIELDISIYQQENPNPKRCRNALQDDSVECKQLTAHPT